MKGILKRAESDEEVELQAVSLLGRSSECQVIVADPRVSRRHAMVRKQDGGFFLFDLGSFNGSYLNDSRVTTARRLKSGDIIGIAEHEFRFEQQGEESDVEDLDTMGGSTIALIRSTPVIILVSDIFGFTSLSEELEANDLAQIMGSWYADCEQILVGEGGTVDKFIGDSVLAYWTTVNEETTYASLRVAEKLIASCERINQQHPDVFGAKNLAFEIGVAIHTGKVAYGGMSQGEFTLVGDPVNLTFRLESLTREMGKNVLLSGDFARQLPNRSQFTENLGVHQVKGRAQGVEVVALNSFPPAQGEES